MSYAQSNLIIRNSDEFIGLGTGMMSWRTSLIGRSARRDGCVPNCFNFQLQKSPTPNFDEKCGNLADISKGFSQTGMCEFESSRPSQAFRVSENFLLSMRKARQLPAFLIAKSL